MVNPRQRKKVKNSIASKKKKKGVSKKAKIPDISLVKSHWDKSKSLSENYSNLGLMRRINKVKGGISEAITEDASKPIDIQDYEDMDAKTLSKIVGKGYGVIERDEQGNIKNITIAEPSDYLDTPLPKVKAKTEFLKDLEAMNKEVTPAPKYMSEYDIKFCMDLINKHGDDYKAMARDYKLNRDQLTVAQLRKKLNTYYMLSLKEE